jgi:signal transduction histidine kinase
MHSPPSQPEEILDLDSLCERVAVLENIIEIQERQLLRAEELAHERGLCLQAVMEIAPAAILLLDSTQRIIRFNAVAERLSQRLGAEIIGAPVSLLFPNLEVDLCTAAARDKAIATELATSEEGTVPVRLHVRAFNGRAEECGLVVVALDQRDRLRHQVQIAHDKKLRSVGALASGIAHEINTPIQFVGDSIGFLDESTRGISDLLNAYRQALRDSQGQRAGVEIMAALEQLEKELDIEFIQEEMPLACARAREGVERVTAIVGAMRYFAHPDSATHQAVDLNQMVETALVIARNEYKYVAEVKTELNELPPVPCAKGGVDQVILNLLVNAAQAVAEKVPTHFERGLISITTFCDGTDACIRIADNGPGLDETILERVFDPFFTTKPEGVGTGQGLTICRQIIESDHGGKLEVDSVPGSGACFTVRLPLQKTAQPVLEPSH